MYNKLHVLYNNNNNIIKKKKEFYNICNPSLGVEAVSWDVYMQCGGHARVTDGARLELVGPAPTHAAEAEVAARQQQHAALPFTAPTAPPVTVADILIRRLSALHLSPVIAAAARLHFLLHVRRSAARLRQG